MTGKQATRGQKQIYDENRSAIQFYSIMSVLSSLAVALINLFVFEATTFVWVRFFKRVNFKVRSFYARSLIV